MKNRKLSVFFVTMLLLFTSVLIHNEAVYAAEETEGVNISKNLEIDPDTQQQSMDVVFTLPVINEIETIDVVFVMDKSFIDSTIVSSLKNLVEEMNMFKNAKFNIAVINFDVNVADRLNGLRPLSDTSLTDIKNSISTGFGAGSNMQGAVLRAQQILDASPSKSENKYVVLASDFAGNKIDSGNGLGRVQFTLTGNRYVGFGDPLYTGAHLPNNHDFDSKYSKGDNAFFAALTVHNIDNLIRNNTMLSGTQVDSSNPNYKYLVEIGETVGEFYPDLIRSGDKPFTDDQKANIPTFEKVRETSFPTMLEKNIYHSGNTLLEMKQSGYNLISYTKPYISSGFTRGNRFEIIANLYQEWFESEIGKRYHTEKNENITDLINEFKDDVFYEIGKGEITDVVDSRYEVKKGDYKVLLNDSDLEVHEIDVNKYGFGSIDSNGNYPYELIYSQDSISKKETIIWKINIPANSFDVLKFKFGIQLKEFPKISGTHVYPTNESAKIDYLSTQDIIDGITSYTKYKVMPSPEVTYQVGQVIATYVDESGNILAPQEEVIARVGSSYTTNQKTIDAYELLRIEGNGSGIITLDDQSVKYVYRKVSVPRKLSSVIAHFVDESGTKLSQSVTLTGFVGDNYSIIRKLFSGYSYLRVDGLPEGLFSETPTTLTFVYSKENSETKTSKIIVKYTDDKGNNLSFDESFIGIVGSQYETIRKEFDGYSFVRVEGEAKGLMGETDKTITYVYRKTLETTKTGTVKIMFIDKDGNILAKDIILSGKIGSPYQSEPLEIDGYRYIEIKGKQTGVFDETSQEVVFIYEKLILPKAGVGDTFLKFGFIILFSGLGLVFIKKKRNHS